MKKKLLVLLLVLCAIVCFGVFSAAAEEEHVHCVCGGSPIDAQYHTCSDVTWQPLPEGTTDFGTLAKGNYYLTGDVTVTAISQIKVDLKICLNGHNINTSTSRVFGNTRTSSGKLTVTDCSYDAAAKTWDGTITGGDSSSGYGSIIYTHYSSTLNIYGGNWTGNGKHIRMGGLIVVAQDGAPDTKDENGTVTLKGTSDPTKAATLNLYGGKLYGGLAGTGGNIHVMHCGKMNMYGGTITEGHSKYTYWKTTDSNGKESTTYKVSQGGNIYTDAGSVTHIYDGEISNGVAMAHGGLNSTAAVGSGGNIYANGELYIHGGVICDGLAQENPRTTTNSEGKLAYIKTSGGSVSTEIDGRGGNIYTTKKLVISGGQIYGGQANGNGGGNIYQSAGAMTISGGKIWGGVANADNSAAGGKNLVNSYDVCGGSVRIQGGNVDMTGGSIGIDAEGKPAGGTTKPSGSEAGNVYFYSSSSVVNLSGGKIAYGNVIGLDADGKEIYGTTSKGGNIGGGAKVTYSDNIEVFGGYAKNAGNITMFNNGNAKIKGGKIYGGKATGNGGNILMSGNGTTVHTLEITGGEIYGGTADKGGNICVEVYKTVNISGDVKIYDGVATTNGGNIGMAGNSTLNIGEGVKLTGSETEQANGANIYASGTITVNIDGAEIVGGYTTGNGPNIFTGSQVTLNISNSTIKDGKSDKNGGCNLYATGKITLTDSTFIGGDGHAAGGNVKFSNNTSKATITGCTFEGGKTTTTGGNLYSEGVVTIENCIFKNGQAGSNGGNLSVGNGSKTTVKNCTFENGSAEERGGNVYTYTTAELTLEDCTLKNGIATNEDKTTTYGGNMYSIADVLVITGGTFEGGKAMHAGNLYTGSGDITVTGTTFKNGEANLNLDGKGNGNGGNVETSSDGDSKFIGCTFEGGKALRGGSIACFGKTTLTDCTIGAGESVSGGGTVFVYETGYMIANGTTTIAGGNAKNGSGGAIHVNSFGTKAQTSEIAGSVKITNGTAKEGPCVYLAAGDLVISDNAQVQELYVNNAKDGWSVDVSDLETTTPITVYAAYSAKIAEAATDKTACFEYPNGYLTYTAAETEGEKGYISIVTYRTLPYTTTLGAGLSTNAALYNVGGMIVTIPNVAEGTVTYNGTVYTPDENGTITFRFEEGRPGTPYQFTLTNNSDESLKFEVTAAFPVGHPENADTLVIGENTATLTEGNSTGYNYTYTAEKTGTLTITMDGAGWMYCINNLTSYQYGDTVVYVDGSATASIAVTEGDELQIMVNTFDPADPWTAPAGTITFTAQYANYVAEANGVKYETLEAALAQGGNVTLLKDVTLTEKTTIEGTVTLNLGGYTLTTYAENGNYGFVVKGDLTIEGEGNVVVNGVYGIGVLGALTVNGGTFTTSADSDYMIGSWGTTTINGGHFTGIYNVLNNFNGTSTVTGGTFVTAETDATGEYESCDLFANAGLTVTGGTFSKNVNEYCAQGLAIAPNGDGTYGVVEAVAEADGQGYATLTEALTAGGNITLLKDITLTEKTTVEGTVTLNLGGKTLSTYAENGNYGFVVKGNLTIEGEGNIVANGVYGIGVLGTLTVNGGTFTTSADSDYMIGSWGTTTINGGHFTGIYNVLNNFNGTSTVTGGTFVTAETDATGEYESCDLFANAGLTVTGGIFSKDVTEYCAPYLAAFDNGDGTWYIGDAAGSQNNPIMVEWTWNEEYTEATASVTVPAGLTYHYTAYVSGMELTINGEVYGVLNGSRWMPATFTVTNDTEEEATFELKIAYLPGSMENPAEFVIGTNTATIAAGAQGYFYTWTAEEDGVLTITMPEGDWAYTINNMTSYQYGDMQWSDSDPVVNPATVEVKKGDELQIVVNTYDPANPWENPAGELAIEASFEYAPGHEQNPIMVEWTWNEEYTEATASVTVPAGKTYYYTAYVSGMELTINGEVYGVLNGSRWMPATFTVTNDTEEEATFELKIAYLPGSMENPAEFVIGTNTATIAAGAQGYFYTWTAEEDGVLTITMPEGDWAYTINNMTSYQYGDMQWSDSDPVVNPATVEVKKGDELQIVVNSYDPANPWVNPAAELNIEASFEYAPGTAQNPIFVEWTWNEEYTEATASVTVPAGKTYNYAAYVSGMELTINGEVYGVLNGSRWMPATFAITNEGDAEATYELKISYPMGTQANPATLVLGSNTATIIEGNNQGYYFTWTATETGALVITMPAGDWMYCINNMTSYQYGDMQWSDSDPVVNTAVISVTEGDVIEVIVSTYDPANPWTTPAGELTFTAATSQFVAQVGDKQYVDLATAVKEANGETVILLQDLVLTEKLVLEGTATLDMNWCTITTAAVEGNYGVVVKGDLTLDGYGTWNINGVYGIGVQPTGSLTINNGYFYAAENNDYLIGNWGTTTIYGGMYYGIYSVLNVFEGTATIDGGEFNTEEFDCTGEYEAYDVFVDEDGTLTIISGMFSKDVSEYCAEGKVCIDTGYGMYTVSDPVGTETNPVVFYDLENTVVNVGTMYYMTYSDGLIMTITGEEGYSLTIGGETIVPEGGVYTTVVTQIDYLPMTFAITGDGTFTVNFVYPIGAVENPDSLVIGENTTSVDENSWGYYYTWIATGNGTLTITGTEGMQFNVNNLTSYVYGDYMVGTESYSVAVAEGDEIQVSVNTYNPDSWWSTPAGDVTFTATFEAEGGNEPEGPIVGEGEVATPDAPIVIEYTANAKGTLSITVSGTPGFKVEVYDANGETVGLPSTGKTEKTLTYELTEGVYTIRMVGYANWDEASATINYSISFTADEGGETEKAEYEVDYNTTLVVGDNTITLLDTAITTIYAFEPTEEGTYTITAPEGAIVGYWGAGEWFLFDPMSTTNSTEWKCTSVGQSAYIGISGIEGEFTVTVEKTAEGQGQEQIEYLVYENVHTFPEGFNTLTGEETLLNVNITEAHTAVLGTDGYYHLDSATGPVLYVDLQTEGFDISVAAAPGGANVMRGEVDGVKYDFLSAMSAYVSCDVYPLTEDTMKFIKGYGKYQGWFISGMSPFAEINEGNANADTAWMVLCRYVEVQEPEIEKFDIDVARMILGNALEFQFGVAKSKFTTTEGYYAVIEKTWADGTTTEKTIPASEWGVMGGYYAIIYDGLAAKEMGDTFYVTIYNEKGQAVSNAKEDSVRAYVARAYAGQSAKGKTMMVDMLNYGAAAQTHFSYGTSDLANAKLTDAQKAVATATAPEMSNDQVKGANYQGTRFLLTSAIQVQLAFKNMTTDMYAIYTYQKADGTAKEVRVEGTDFVIIGGKPAGVELSALVYSDARALVNVTVYNADGTVYGTASDSIESCALRSDADVFVALMKFADSAKASLYG